MACAPCIPRWISVTGCLFRVSLSSHYGSTQSWGCYNTGTSLSWSMHVDWAHKRGLDMVCTLTTNTHPLGLNTSIPALSHTSLSISLSPILNPCFILTWTGSIPVCLLRTFMQCIYSIVVTAFDSRMHVLSMHSIHRIRLLGFSSIQYFPWCKACYWTQWDIFWIDIHWTQ